MGGVILSEGIILVASVIVAAAFSATVLNQMGIFQSAISATTAAEKDIALTKVKLVYASNSSSTEINVWAKNVGSTPIRALDRVDVYFGQLGSVQRIPYNQPGAPTWAYSSAVQVWQIKDTLQIDITSDADLERNVTYVIKLTAPNGVGDEYIFSIS